MDKLRFGVIGAGHFGERHIQVLSRLPNVDVVGICRRSPEPLKETAKRYGIPNIYTDYHQLLANRDIDAVSITTYSHLEPALAALNAGKHVLVEKPMARNTLECDQLLDAARRMGSILMVGHVCRFDVRYAAAKKEIDEGRIGKIASIYARRNIPGSLGGSILDRISPFMGSGIHDADLMLWYTGDKVKTVYARTLSLRGLPNPDIGWAMIQFETGTIGTFENVYCLPHTTPFSIDAQMEIIGERGAIYIGGIDQGVMINDDSGWKMPEIYTWPTVNDQIVGALKEEIAYFVDCVLRGEKPDFAAPEESREAVRIMAAAEESANSGSVIPLA